jgi:predicted transcriptional regulator
MRVTLDIPDEMHARLKALAKKEGTTMRAIILRAIENLIRTSGTDSSREKRERLQPKSFDGQRH